MTPVAQRSAISCSGTVSSGRDGADDGRDDVELTGPVGGGDRGAPERVPAGEVEAVERAGSGQRLDLVGREPDAPAEVGHRLERAAPVAFGR